MKIAVINRTTNISDAEAGTVMEALRIQVTRDFFPEWGLGAELSFTGKGSTPPPGSAWLVLLDNADQAGVLGYHDETIEGQPIGKIFVETTRHFGGIWSVTASHELLEMLADPDVNGARQVGNTPVFYALEICDAVEADADGYEIETSAKVKVTVSNFQTRAYFRTRPSPNAKFDFRGLLTAPFSLRPGGYMGVWKPGTGWTQLTHSEMPDTDEHRGRIGSRRERRGVDRTRWRRSSAHPELRQPAD